MAANATETTRLLQAWRAGDAHARDQLLVTVYEELRQLAAKYLRRERADHTLQPTALVHEAYLQLIDQSQANFESRAHFFGVAAHLMRRILVDHARTHKAEKRGSGGVKIALDDADDRPLIVDQPEENLDPKSIYDELVPLFRAAKAKRQVVLVTHNANLVVNTDADQVIVASAGAHAPGQLPPITYTSGGLEEAAIRKLVCDILEGGEAAFRERARRLRVRIDR